MEWVPMSPETEATLSPPLDLAVLRQSAAAAVSTESGRKARGRAGRTGGRCPTDAVATAQRATRRGLGEHPARWQKYLLLYRQPASAGRDGRFVRPVLQPADH